MKHFAFIASTLATLCLLSPVANAHTSARAERFSDRNRPDRLWCTIDGSPATLLANTTPDMETGDTPSVTANLKPNDKLERGHFQIRLSNGKKQLIRLVMTYENGERQIALSSRLNGRMISVSKSQPLTLGDAVVSCVHVDDERID